MNNYFQKNKKWIKYDVCGDGTAVNAFDVPHSQPTTHQQRKENSQHIHKNDKYIGSGDKFKRNNKVEKLNCVHFFYKTKLKKTRTITKN